jgi:putative zinc finger/helix-turn-helix YgiT family protein
MSQMRYCEICGCERETVIKERNAKYKFRKEPFEIVEEYRECTVCHDDVYDEETANKTLQQLSQLYQNKHSFSFEEIKKIRKSTGLTQSQFAKVLNMGEATIKRYESGTSMPDGTQLGILKMLKKSPNLILRFFEENKNALTLQERQIIQEKLQGLTTDNIERSTFEILKLLYSQYEYKIENGYSIFKPEKLYNMILLFARDGVLKTKLMKLLWYSDFLMYKRYKCSISGTPYWHKEFGPVPVEHDTVLGCGTGLNLLSIDEKEDTSSGYTRMVVKSKRPFDKSLFSEEELKILYYIEEFFNSYGSRSISDFSHKEVGWKETSEEQIIQYTHSESLQFV